jgi:hypothetical protein
MIVRTRLPGWLNAYVSRVGLYLKDVDLLLPLAPPPGFNVRGALYFPTGEKRMLAAHNLVSDDGELHYAQLINQDVPTNAFGVTELASAVPGVPASTDDRSDYTIIATSEKAHSATYPKINDTDTDNSGKGADVYTFKNEWTAGDGNWADIDGGIITNATPGATEAILTGFTITNFAKDSSTALNLWVNHAPTGV